MIPASSPSSFAFPSPGSRIGQNKSETQIRSKTGRKTFRMQYECSVNFRNDKNFCYRYHHLIVFKDQIRYQIRKDKQKLTNLAFGIARKAQITTELEPIES